MDCKVFFLEIVKIVIWPLILLTFIVLYRQQIQGLISSISKLAIGNLSAEFGKRDLADKLSPKESSQENQESNSYILSREEILNIPDEDYEFMEKIAKNINFMATSRDEVFKYNSLVNHGYFTSKGSSAYEPTEKGSKIINALKSIHHS